MYHTEIKIGQQGMLEDSRQKAFTLLSNCRKCFDILSIHIKFHDVLSWVNWYRSATVWLHTHYDRCVFFWSLLCKRWKQKFGDIIGSEYLSYLSACHRFRFASYPHVLSITFKTFSFWPFNVYAVMENCPVSHLVCLCCSLMVEQLYMFKRHFHSWLFYTYMSC